MQTEADSTTPSNNFSVVRINRELPNRSAFGGIVVNRQGTGRIARVDDYNRSYALDGRLGIGATGLISGFAANTITPGIGGRTHALRIGARRDGEVAEVSSEYTEVGEGFNPEVGFFSRRGFRNLDSSIMTRFRPSSFLRLQEIRPHTSYRAYWNFAGFQETGYWHIDSHWEFKKGAEIHTGMNVTREGVVTPFEIFPGVIVPTGTYDHIESQLVTFTNESHWWSVRNTLTVGGFFGGDRVAISPALTVRAGETFFTTVTWNRNDIDLPGGSFVTNLVRTRVSYSFTPRVFVQSLIRYNDRADIWSLNVRLGWLQRANTGLFVVLNETNALEDLVRPATGRSFVIKFSRMFDLLD